MNQSVPPDAADRWVVYLILPRLHKFLSSADRSVLGTLRLCSKTAITRARAPRAGFRELHVGAGGKDAGRLAPGHSRDAEDGVQAAAQ